MSTEVPADTDARADEWLEGLRRGWAQRLDTPVGLDGEDVVAHTFAGDAVHRGVLHAPGIEGQTDGPTLRLVSAPGEVRTRAAQCIADLAPVLDREAERLADLKPVAHRALSAPSVLVAEAREFEVDADGIEAVPALLAAWPS